MPPLVSILIPAYNAEKWIADTLRSALAQTWPHKEVVVIDDGSSDRTVEIARSFVSPLLMVHIQPNRGAAAARNHAYSVCRGDYVQWLDADDLLHPEKIRLQMEAAATRGSRRTLLSSAWGSFYYRADHASFTPTPLWQDLTPLECLKRKMESNCFMQTSAWLVSRELSEAAGPWDTRLLGDDDGEYFCRVTLASDGVRFVPEAKTYYRQVGTNRLSFIHGSARKLEAEMLSVRLHVGYLLRTEDSPATREACLRFMQTSLPAFYPERPDLMAEMIKLAQSIGGTLESPRLRSKYRWLAGLFGLPFAKKAQLALPQLKRHLQRNWDLAMFQLTRGASLPSSRPPAAKA